MLKSMSAEKAEAPTSGSIWSTMTIRGQLGASAGGGLCEDLTTSLIRPIVEDMAEEVDQGTCPQQLVSACGKRFGGTMI